MIIDEKELKQNKFGMNYEQGYRIVYFYNDDYKIGEYCKTIEGFMISFAECNPIMETDDIPKFISTNDLLNRYLEEMQEVTGVAIYNINGECVAKIDR